MRLTPVTWPQNVRLDEFVSRVAYFFDLRDWYEWQLLNHRRNVWWRRWAVGNRLNERRLIRRMRHMNREIANLTVDLP